MHRPHRENNRAHIHLPANLGEKVADKVVSGMGSWKFIIIQTIVIVAWITGNVWLIFHFDPFPFIFLNLAFSAQAAYAAPLILMCSNRAAARDKKRDDLESEEVQSLFDNHLLLLKMQQQQMEILDLLKLNGSDTHEALGMLLESAGWQKKEVTK